MAAIRRDYIELARGARAEAAEFFRLPGNGEVRILVTGAGGMLGTDLVERLSSEHEVIGAAHDDLDVSNSSATKSLIAEMKPDLVLHAAAYTDVDGCESNPDLAYAVNALGAQNVALGCQLARAAMLYFSTDYVFDGSSRTPYIEWDRPNPLSVYGRSKYAGERAVAHLLDKYYIVRLAWLYGERGKNFVKTMLKLGEERGSVSVVTDQIGSPTYTKDVAEGVARLIETGNYGIYHMVNSGHCSWFDFAAEIYRLAGKDVEMRPIGTAELGRPAPRPPYSALRNFALEKTIGDPMRPWKEALADFLSALSASDEGV